MERRRYIRTADTRGTLLDGKREGLWLEILGGELHTTWWRAGVLVFVGPLPRAASGWRQNSRK